MTQNDNGWNTCSTNPVTTPAYKCLSNLSEQDFKTEVSNTIEDEFGGYGNSIGYSTVTSFPCE